MRVRPIEKQPAIQELELCLNRMIEDAKDDFTPDPLGYRDLLEARNEIIKLCRNELLRAMKDLKGGLVLRKCGDYDVPKSNYVIRHAVNIHPIDRIYYHFVLHRLAPLIEKSVSRARCSYPLVDPNSKYIFGKKKKVYHWVKMKNQIRDRVSSRKYQYVLSTDIAGFYEYVHTRDFKKQICRMAGLTDDNRIIGLMDRLVKHCPPNPDAGLPQNYDPSSYLASAFLDFLDKDLEVCELEHYRYVDDIKVLCRSKAEAKKAVTTAIRSLRKFNLNLSTAKTEIWDVNEGKYRQYVREFPDILSQVDAAINKRNGRVVNRLFPFLVRDLKALLRKSKEFDERLFRAYIWRITKCHWYKKLKKVSLNPITQRCLKLLEETPWRSDTFMNYMLLERNRKTVQNQLSEFLESEDNIYAWQEMWIWRLLVQAERIKNGKLFVLARKRMQDIAYPEPARNYAMLFLGKHGNYNDKRNLLSRFDNENAYFTKRIVLIAIQEYAEKNVLYNRAEKEIELSGLIQYLRKRRSPEYIHVEPFKEVDWGPIS